MKLLIIGSSGLIGGELLRQSIEDNQIDEIEVWLRKASDFQHPKCTQKVINFDSISKMQNIDADSVCITLGSTIKKAGSKDAFRQVDFDYVVNAAKLAQKSGVKQIVIVSSLGANPESNNFYLRTKGEMEATVMNMDVQNIAIIRPALLVGERAEFRFGERLAGNMFRILNPLLVGQLKQYRSVNSVSVAKAMLFLARGGMSGKVIIRSDEIEKISQNVE